MMPPRGTARSFLATWRRCPRGGRSSAWTSPFLSVASAAAVADGPMGIPGLAAAVHRSSDADAAVKRSIRDLGGSISVGFAAGSIGRARSMAGYARPIPGMGTKRSKGGASKRGSKGRGDDDDASARAEGRSGRRGGRRPPRHDVLGKVHGVEDEDGMESRRAANPGAKRGGGLGGGRGNGEGRGGVLMSTGGKKKKRMSAGKVTKVISVARRVDVILGILSYNLETLNPIHVSAACNRLGKLARTNDTAPRRLTEDYVFNRLLRLARHYAEKSSFEPRHVANTTHGLAKLRAARRIDGSEEDVEKTLAALEAAAGRVALAMNDQEVVNQWYAFATLERMPGDDTWQRMNTAARRVSPTMTPQGVSNLLWAYATLGKSPDDDTWHALDAAVLANVQSMTSQGVAMTLWSYATLEKPPGEKTKVLVEAAARRTAPGMIPSNVSDVVWAFATLDFQPGDDTWHALDAAVKRAAAEMDAEAAMDAVWAYTKLGRTPGDATWETLVKRGAGFTEGEEAEDDVVEYEVRENDKYDDDDDDHDDDDDDDDDDADADDDVVDGDDVEEEEEEEEEEENTHRNR